MENASKALIIAGAIFLVIIIISFGVYTYQSIHNFSKMQDEQLEQKQVADFNKSFEAYNKSIMYGVDIATLINKVNENNKKYPDDNIEIIFKLKEEEDYRNNNAFNSIKNDGEAFKTFKKRIFKCDGVQYNEDTGRIMLMSFEEIS